VAGVVGRCAWWAARVRAVLPLSCQPSADGLAGAAWRAGDGEEGSPSLSEMAQAGGACLNGA